MQLRAEEISQIIKKQIQNIQGAAQLVGIPRIDFSCVILFNFFQCQQPYFHQVLGFWVTTVVLHHPVDSGIQLLPIQTPFSL